MIQAIHISDTHIGPSRDFEVWGVNPLNRVNQLIDAVNDLDFQPDLIIHTGDVTNEPIEEAYPIAAEALSRLPAAVYCVTGNHDDAEMIRRHLNTGPSVDLDPDPNRIASRIDLDGHRIFLLDAKVPEEDGPHGKLPASQLAALESNLNETSEPFSIFLHFPPFPVSSPWIDSHLLLENGAELHALLLETGHSRNRGVFFGHLHRGLQIYRDGILYSGVASPTFSFRVGPNDEMIAVDGPGPIPFNHITFSRDGTSVKEYRVL